MHCYTVICNRKKNLKSKLIEILRMLCAIMFINVNFCVFKPEIIHYVKNALPQWFKFLSIKLFLYSLVYINPDTTLAYS